MKSLDSPEADVQNAFAHPLRNALLWIGAVVCMTTAFFIVLSMGLPERAEYTGQIIPGELPIAPEIGAVAPPFELTTTAGDKINLSTLRGSPVLVNFWATWCEPCRVEMPGLENLYRDYEAKGLHILAVNLGESSQAVQGWANDLGLTFDLLLDSSQQTATLYQLRGQPSTYVISPEGIITQIFFGPVNQDSFQAAIAPFFPNR